MELSYLQTQNSNADYLSELNSLKDELAAAQQSLEAVQEKIDMQKSRDVEIEKLQVKAREFENYMRTTNRRSSLSPEYKEYSSNDANSQASCESNSENRLYTESKIRDEMAKIFANQIKTLERRFVEEAKKLQTQIISLTSELDARTADLEVAAEQLELLKFTIVHEREEFQEILKQKDESFKEKLQKYQKHASDLNEQMALIDGERELIESLKRQIDEERTLLGQKELDTAQRIRKLQQESTKIIDELNEKYKTAKKTAASYKQVSVMCQSYF
jgi:centrosomal protein CEP152